jgi:hypothetical protein
MARIHPAIAAGRIENAQALIGQSELFVSAVRPAPFIEATQIAVDRAPAWLIERVVIGLPLIDLLCRARAILFAVIDDFGNDASNGQARNNFCDIIPVCGCRRWGDSDS